MKFHLAGKAGQLLLEASEQILILKRFDETFKTIKNDNTFPPYYTFSESSQKDLSLASLFQLIF